MKFTLVAAFCAVASQALQIDAETDTNVAIREDDDIMNAEVDTVADYEDCADNYCELDGEVD